MIVGIGVDLVKIDRIEKIVAEKEERFLNKIFTKKEIDYILNKNKNPQTISGIFAAKEATSKALGTGIGKIAWKDIEIVHNEKSKPYLKLHKNALKVSKKLGVEKIDLTISHEKEYAIAFVVGEGFCSNRIDLDIDDRGITDILLKREKESHKGTYGRVGILAGSTGMTGACTLSSMAALRSGSGLVYSIIPKTLFEILSIKLTEVVLRPVEDEQNGYFVYDHIADIQNNLKDLDVIALGPGIGTNEETVKVVEEIIRTCKKPIVLDADGLNCISSNPKILLERQEATIITPHPGELSRLIDVSIREIQNNRIKYSKNISKKYNVITVLKGSNTIVADEKGEIYINNTGNPGMATAGSGDVLTGMISSFIGQKIEPRNAAILGVYLHGLSGDLAKMKKGEYAMIARDILKNIPSALKIIEKD